MHGVGLAADDEDVINDLMKIIAKSGFFVFASCHFTN